jgi:hypothetical protein
VDAHGTALFLPGTALRPRLVALRLHVSALRLHVTAPTSPAAWLRLHARALFLSASGTERDGHTLESHGRTAKVKNAATAPPTSAPNPPGQQIERIDDRPRGDEPWAARYGEIPRRYTYPGILLGHRPSFLRYRAFYRDIALSYQGIALFHQGTALFFRGTAHCHTYDVWRSRVIRAAG